MATTDARIPAIVAENRLRTILREHGGDPEAAHELADDALIALLRGLGFSTICDLYEEVEKWYA